jgi:hypothetical protein
MKEVLRGWVRVFRLQFQRLDDQAIVYVDPRGARTRSGSSTLARATLKQATV